MTTTPDTDVHVPVATPAARRPMEALTYWLVVATIGAGCLLAWLSHDLLPEKFFLDEAIILRFASGELQSDGLSSYGTTGWLYRVSGLASIPSVFPVLAYLVFVVAVLAAVTWRGIARLSVAPLVLTVGTLLLGAAYLSQYSKEFFVLPLTALLLGARRSVVLEVVWVALALTYAGFVRPYWFLVVALYLAFRLLIPRLRSAWLLVGVVLVGFAVMIIAFQVFLSQPLTYFRTDINNALEFDRSTQINDLVPGESFGAQWVNAAAVMASLAVPVPLLLSGSGLQTLAGAFMAVCWILVASRIRRVTGQHGTAVMPLALLLAFLMVQAAFEPDYGSYIRHICPQLPLFLAVLVRTTARGDSR